MGHSTITCLIIAISLIIWHFFLNDCNEIDVIVVKNKITLETGVVSYRGVII